MTGLLERPAVVAVAVAYLAAVLAIGVWAALRTKDARDYFVAGRRVGLVAIGLATMASAFSGFVFVGGPGLMYRVGLSSLFIVLPIGFTSAMLCWTLAPRLFLLAEIRDVYTIPDALALRFPGRTTAGFAAIAIALGTVAYLAAQLLAFAALARAFGATGILGTSQGAIIAGGAVILAYSFAGGMLAGIYTDVLQGLVMIGAAIWTFAAAMQSTGGARAAIAAIEGDPARGAAFFDPFGAMPEATAFGLFFVFGTGVLGQPHMLHKFLMLRDPRVLRFMPAVIGGSQALVLLVWVGIGLAVPALVAQGAIPALAAADDATAAFLKHAAPDVLAGLVLAGALAAIMSSADSFLNLASAAIARDLPRVLARPLVHEMRAARLSTLAVSLLAGALASTYGDLVALLGTFAFGLFAAALAPVLAIGLSWERVTPRAASASIATGVTVAIVLEAWARSGNAIGIAEWGGVVPGAVALAASIVVLVGGTALDRAPRPELPAEIRAALDFDA